MPITPVINKKSLDLLKMYYKAAMRRLTSDISSATQFDKSRRMQIIHQANTILDELNSKSRQWTEKQIAESYQEGSQLGFDLLKKVKVDAKNVFSTIDQDSINAMTDETFMDFGNAIKGVGRGVEKLMTEAEKQNITARLAEDRITGETLKTIKNDIIASIPDYVGFRDKSGKIWDPEVYAEMLGRTKMADATNKGLIHQVSQNGIDLVIASTHGGSCPLCLPYDGQILSITGNSEDYDSVEDAKDNGFLHPNCEHRLYPYSDDFQTAAENWSEKEDISDEED